MKRLGVGLKVALPLALALHLRFHHEFHGPAIDYVGLALGSAASWIGIPGPGEPLLIATGIVAAKHNLSIVSVLIVAWAGATAGGIVGWLIGLVGGRPLLTRRGPLLKMRLRALAHGEEVFTRYPVIAIILTPSWIAGINRVGTGVYMVTNAVTAVIWAVGIGLGAYYAGPPIVDLVDDAGWVTVLGVVLLVSVVVGAEVTRRRRRRARTSSSPPASSRVSSVPEEDTQLWGPE
jgi:membrane protein DedA with SNARE-associated domain